MMVVLSSLSVGDQRWVSGLWLLCALLCPSSRWPWWWLSQTRSRWRTSPLHPLSPRWSQSSPWPPSPELSALCGVMSCQTKRGRGQSRLLFTLMWLRWQQNKQAVVLSLSPLSWHHHSIGVGPTVCDGPDLNQRFFSHVDLFYRYWDIQGRQRACSTCSLHWQCVHTLCSLDWR